MTPTQIPAREISVITMEIRTLHKQAQQLILGYAIEIGRRLAEAKLQLPHGRWGQWLKEEVEFSQSTANNFMRIFDAYGADQLGLFGPEANSQTLGNLPYTKALQLLAVPEEEREDFAKDNDVENLSSRQLEQLIRERDQENQLRMEAQERAADLEQRMQDMEGQLETATLSAAEELQRATQAMDQALQDAQSAAADRAKQQAVAAAQVQELTAKLDKAKSDAVKAKENLRKLRDEPPVVSPEILEEMRKQAEKEAQDAAAKELEDKLAEAAGRAAQAEKAALEASAAMEAAQKQLALAAPQIAQFQVHFAAWQEQFNKMLELLAQAAPETAAKLKSATATVANQMLERCQ